MGGMKEGTFPHSSLYNRIKGSASPNENNDSHICRFLTTCQAPYIILYRHYLILLKILQGRYSIILKLF